MKKQIFAMLFAGALVQAGVKIASLDVNQAVGESKMVAAMKQSFKDKFDAKQKAIEAQQTKLFAESKQFEKDKSLMKEDKIKAREVALKKQFKSLGEKRKDLSEAVGSYQQKELKKIQERLKSVSQKIMKQGDYKLVINKEVIITSDPKVIVDITDEVKEQLK
ncbi:OmpH family outer membrane protein [Gammaproteobacteria bacterium]|nr:OmpH family outer membrane protein [Gammaproteobacteria bacterium]